MDLNGKKGIIMGVANERSIAWGIAKACRAGGAELVLSCQNERLRSRVAPLAEQVGAHCMECDLADDDSTRHFFEQAGGVFGGKLDFLVHAVAFANREDLKGRYVDTSREGFRLAMEVSVYTLVLAAHHALPLMRAAGGGSVLAMSYYGAEKVVPNYNVMGVAKAGLEASVRYLAADLGPEGVRVNAISAGPVKTLAASGISNFGDLLKQFADRAPMRCNIDAGQVGETSAFLVSDAASGITGEVLYVDAGFHIMGM